MRPIPIILLLAWCTTAWAADTDEIARLVDQLGDARFTVREDATRRLREAGPTAIPALSAALASDSAERRRRADAILVEIDPIWRNGKYLRDQDVKRRRDAIKNIAGYRDPRVLDVVLAQIAVETDVECLRDLLGFVTYLRDPRATSTMAKCLLEPTDAHSREVETVLRALAALGEKSAPVVRAYCKKQLVRAPMAGDKPFEEYWRIQGVGGNVALAEAIAAGAHPECTVPLILMSAIPYDGHGGGVVQIAALRALVKIGPKSGPELTRQLDLFQGKFGPQTSARSLIVKALGRIGDAKAIPTLEKALDDPVPWIAAQSAVSLDQLGSDKGAAWFLAKLRGRKKANDDPLLEPSAVQALGECKHPSLKPLCDELLKSADFSKRWYAAVCLARMGDKAGLAIFHNHLKDEAHLHQAVEILVGLDDASCVPALIRW